MAEGKAWRRLSAAVVVDGPRGARLRPAALARWLERHAPRSAAGTVAVALVSDARMRRLNRVFRGVDRPTDVLSFPSGDRRRAAPTAPSGERPPGSGSRRRAPAGAPNGAHLGDLAIAVGVAGRQARAEGHGLATELRVLALHGLLHLLGYDHERDRGAMRIVEERLRRRAGLPAGLIARRGRRASHR